ATDTPATDMGPDYPTDEAYKTAQDAIAAANAGDKKFTDYEMADKFKIIAKHEMGTGYKDGDEKTYMGLNYHPPKETVVDATATDTTATKDTLNPFQRHAQSTGVTGIGTNEVDTKVTNTTQNVNTPTVPTGPRHTDVHGNDIPQNVNAKTVTPTPIPTPTYIHSEGETFVDKNSTMKPYGGSAGPM
ncbi:MAG: hypothetical protein U9Q72_00515, partial [Patescibacteria group bacterium]|nr:hypothetical protein [Patescibacteria group bacterium]